MVRFGDHQTLRARDGWGTFSIWKPEQEGEIPSEKSCTSTGNTMGLGRQSLKAKQNGAHLLVTPAPITSFMCPTDGGPST